MSARFLSRTARSIRRNVTPGRVLNLVAVLVIVFVGIGIVEAATPNPGHPWTDVGDGVFQVANTQTALRTYTFPNTDAEMVTDATFSQGDIIYGSSASNTAQLPKDTNATRYLSNTGTNNNPAWAQINLTNGVSGILPSTNGGTGNGFAKFSGPTTSEKTFTLPDANATILTSNAAVTLSQGGTNASLTASNGGIVYSGASAFAVLSGSSTAGLMLQSGASGAPTWSTAAYPATASTSGNSLVSNGTNFISANMRPKYMFPVGFSTQTAAVTTNVSPNSYFVYIGKIPAPVTSCVVSTTITTAAATITWAEVGIFKGPPPAWGGSASINRVGFTDVSTTFNTTGAKNVTVAVSGTQGGDDLWVAYGASATTAFQMAGATGDKAQSGLMQQTNGRISLLTIPATISISAATLVAGWLGVACT